MLRDESGFTLIESIVASAVLIATLAGLTYLFLQGAQIAAQARRAPVALAAASSKLDQLLALAWTYDATGAPLSDVASDTSRDPPAPNGGTGLSLSPADSLSRPAAGFVDYVNERGRSLGSAPVPGAIFTRRWLIRPWPASPDSLLLRVCVVRMAGSDAEPPPEVCLGTARVRR
jgi:prepilin-type N-terminal cleavage/methylation domain-containing protein